MPRTFIVDHKRGISTLDPRTGGRVTNTWGWDEVVSVSTSVDHPNEFHIRFCPPAAAAAAAAAGPGSDSRGTGASSGSARAAQAVAAPVVRGHGRRASVGAIFGKAAQGLTKRENSGSGANIVTPIKGRARSVRMHVAVCCCFNFFFFFF